MKPLVLYHRHCTDGFASAWVAHRALGDVEAIPVQYSESPPLRKAEGRKVFVLDFCYKPEAMEDLRKVCDRLTLLDHHPTAMRAMMPGADHSYPYHVRSAGNFWYEFCIGKCGARMAWEHFFPGKKTPWLIPYVEDRDLWKWELPNSREVSAAIQSYPFDFALWDLWAADEDTYLPLLVKEGVAILRYQETLINQACAKAIEVDLGGHKVLCVNSTVLHSEIAGRLAETKDFGVCYFIGDDQKYQYSLRSRASGFDVSKVAQSFGGGGHLAAAGFEADAPVHKVLKG